MNRRDFIKQLALASTLLLLPKITMRQVRQTTEIEISLNGLRMAFLNCTIATNRLTIALHKASIDASGFCEQLLLIEESYEPT